MGEDGEVVEDELIFGMIAWHGELLVIHVGLAQWARQPVRVPRQHLRLNAIAHIQDEEVDDEHLW